MITKKMQEVLEKAERRLEDKPKLLKMFKQCYVNTLETTTKLINENDTFIITGDIEAMWLRDSSAQVFHYLDIAHDDKKLQQIIEGLIHRQMECILLDPYANAFNLNPVIEREYYDETIMQPLVWERKYEIDSLCYPIWLSYNYYSKTKKVDFFDERYLKALYRIVETFIIEQNHVNSIYNFQRPIAHEWGLLETETLQNNGKGLPVNYTGMTWSGFRPSDDACRFGYLIPANMFASVILGYIKEIAQKIYDDKKLYEMASKLKWEIEYGIKCYGIYRHPKFGDIYAYETDGFGNYNLMDDANVPSLLSIPYLGFAKVDDPIYINTRKFILSKENPYYYEGKCAKGIGSPHTPNNYIWHIALSMQGLTASTKEEAIDMIDTIVKTDANTYFTHEGFDKDNPENYTRSWFAWSNSLFASLVYKTYLKD